ncbi:MFS transporter [Candidatus Bathyarchaeota archaeon]|nr:MFS transporter [Candidatus Bathyarchaeota archaeon]
MSFFRELREVWARQSLNWRTVVKRQIFNRFFNQMTMQYSNIYIRELGASPVELGAVNSASGLGSALISLPLGYLQDRYSIRKIYLIGVALLTFVPLFYAMAYRWEFIVPAILISGLGMRIGSCVVICDLSLPNKDRATGRALCEGIGSLPTLLSPIIAAILVTWFGGINMEGIRPLYWIQFTSRVLLFIYLALKLTEVVRPGLEEKKTNPLEGFREVFRQGTATKRWLLFISLSMFTGSMLAPFRYPFAHEMKGAGPFLIGGITTAMILTEALFAAPFGRLSDRIGRKKIYYMLTPIYCFAYLLFAFAPSPEWLIIAGFLMGFRMVTGVAGGAMTPELVPRKFIGRWRGIIGLCTGLITIPAPIIGGLVWEHLGPEWVFIIPVFIDILIRLPILSTIPETLNRKE